VNIATVRTLPVGFRLHRVVGENANEVRHPAKVVERLPNQLGILVKFLDKTPRKIRWSLITNQPVGQARGHVGKVRLEAA
jgi:hypothetical protein